MLSQLPFCGLAGRMAGLTLVLSMSVHAGQYELVGPGGVTAGRVTADAFRLTFDSPGGTTFVYTRDPGFDSSDGRYLGYYNQTLARVIKFPVAGQGRYYSADLDDAFPRDEASLETLRPIGPLMPTTPPAGYGVGRPRWSGGSDPYGLAQRPSISGLPLIAPRGGHPSFAGPPLLSPVPLGPVLPPLVPPPVVTTDTAAIDLPDLPPVTIDLFNGGPRPVRVTLIDHKTGKDFNTMLQPGQSRPMRLRRDGGSRVSTTQQTVDPFGNIATDRYTGNVPPPLRYELVIDQARVRSVSIDRTVNRNAGGVIDDATIHYETIARLPLPSGSRLESGRIDVFRTAIAISDPTSPSVTSATTPVSSLEAAILAR